MAKTYDKIIQSQTEPSTQSLWLNKGILRYYDGAWHIIGDPEHEDMKEQIEASIGNKLTNYYTKGEIENSYATKSQIRDSFQAAFSGISNTYTLNTSYGVPATTPLTASSVFTGAPANWPLGGSALSFRTTYHANVYDGSFEPRSGSKHMVLEEALLNLNYQKHLTAGTGISIDTNNRISCTLDTNVFKVVSELPEYGEANKIYLIYKSEDEAEANNRFREAVYVDNDWEVIGEFQPNINIDTSRIVTGVDVLGGGTTTTDQINPITATVSEGKLKLDVNYWGGHTGSDIPPHNKLLVTTESILDLVISVNSIKTQISSISSTAENARGHAMEAKTKAESAQTSISDLTTVVEGISTTLDSTAATANQAKQKAEDNASSIIGINSSVNNVRNTLTTLQTDLNTTTSTANQAQSTANSASTLAQEAKNLAQTNQTAIEGFDAKITQNNQNLISSILDAHITPVNVGTFNLSTSTIEVTNYSILKKMFEGLRIVYATTSEDYKGLFVGSPFYVNPAYSDTQMEIRYLIMSPNFEGLATLTAIINNDLTSGTISLN